MSLTLYRADGTPKTTAASGLSVPMEPWHVINAVGEPAFASTWSNYGGTYATAAFRKDPLGKVQLRGSVVNSAVGTIFTLPVGYRPPKDISFGVASRGDLGILGYIQVFAATGAVTYGGVVSGGNAFVPLDVVEFDTDTVTAMPTGPQGPQGPTGPTGGNATILMDTWHMVGAVGEPAFNSPFGGISTLPVGFRKDPLGRVHLKGMSVTAGGAFGFGALMFTLPVGYRPPVIQRYAVEVVEPNSTKSMCEVQVGTAGTVSIVAFITGATTSGNIGTSIALDEVEFDTETVTQMPSGPQGPKGDPGGTMGAAGLLLTGSVGGLVSNAAGGYTPPVKLGTVVNEEPVGFYTRNADQSIQVAQAGWYAIDAVVGSGGGYAAATELGLSIFKNGAEQTGMILEGAYYGRVGASGVLYLIPTDKVDFRAWSQNAITTWGFAQVSIARLGGPQGPQGPPGNSVTVPMDTWHVVGVTGEPAFVNGWLSYGAPYPVAAFRKNPLGAVRMRGLIKGGAANTVALTLPVGYRPPNDVGFASPAYGATGQGTSDLRIGADGSVTATTFVNAAGWVWLDCEFDTDSVTAMPVGPQGPPGPSTPIQRVTSLPAIVYDGLEVYWQVDAGPPAVVWHMRWNNTTFKWECLGGNPIAFRMDGEYNGYSAFASGTNITVNAAQNKALQWNINLPVDLWVEVTFSIGVVQKLDAAYHYAIFSTMVSGAVAIGTPHQILRTQHASVNTYEPYFLRSRLGLSANTNYAIYCQTSIQGGSWQFNQNSTYLSLVGSAWPR